MKRTILICFCVLITSACDETPTSQSATESEKTLNVKPVSEAIGDRESGKSTVETASYVFDHVPDKMTVQEKKERFRQLLVPAVQKVYTELEQLHLEINAKINSGKDSSMIEQLKLDYKAASDTELLEKLKPHPMSIVLAQAAMESAWATSRFFREAKNVFGVWSFDSNEPRIAAGEKRGDKTIWLKKYGSIEDSIRDNYRVLALGSAYVEFRKQRVISSDPFELVKYLDKYSELGDKYGEELAAVIRYNKFNKLDL